MATKIMTKKGFLEFIDKAMKENDIVIWTADLTGSTSVHKKSNQKKVTFSFAADAFKDAGVGHIAFGQTPVVAFSICKKKDVSEGAYALLLEQEKSGK